ncbi:E3 ubiquitin-protein ligase KCMF1 [Galendromus occidentalis]|uniref:RING-type E3 ubiquitin transferase n=1 Tax=Galendromus occidentalis TaxID=34638 RepID=A0AAJ7P9A6_9ACAR|nr:E3 ubiquitin-protein ligase KCMF1 [Galendromus occidentalis]
MSRHEGVSCDSCLRSNFKGRRYKCLVCYDYDLCGSCFETGATSARHLSSHAMQCMLPRAEYELYYQGESASLQSEVPLSLTCPYCAKMGLTEATLYDHVCCEHADLATEVVCPICASQPGGEPNNVVLDFVAHIQREHRAAQDDPHSEPHDRQQSRRMLLRGGATSRGSAGSSGGLPRGASRRMPFGSAPLSPRESTMESITEILSQLTAAGRRNHNGQNSSAQHTIQQLQMQMDRQNPQMSRQQLDKIPRRGPSRASLGNHNSLDPSMSIGSLAGGVAGIMPGDRQGAFGAADNGTGSSQFLLARYLNEGGARSSKQGRSSRSVGPDRAQFVENLLLNTLLPNSSLWRVRASHLASSSKSEKPSETSATASAAAANVEEQATEYHSGPEEEPSEGLEAVAANEPGDELSDTDVSPEPRRRRSLRHRNESTGTATNHN